MSAMGGKRTLRTITLTNAEEAVDEVRRGHGCQLACGVCVRNGVEADIGGISAFAKLFP